MKRKSELNILAAEDLLRLCHYETVCHPAYYSCLQLIKYKLDRDFGLSYKEQEAKQKTFRGNSHQFLLSEIKYKIEAQKGRRTAIDFDRKIKDIQQERVKSDYTKESISRENCEKVICESKKLLQFLNNEI